MLWSRFDRVPGEEIALAIFKCSAAWNVFGAKFWRQKTRVGTSGRCCAIRTSMGGARAKNQALTAIIKHMGRNCLIPTTGLLQAFLDCANSCIVQQYYTEVCVYELFISKGICNCYYIGPIY